MADTTSGRVRKDATRSTRIGSYDFVNPYPQMSSLEARVHLFLEGLGVPFSWRKFDGQALAPNLMWLMPTFIPEFTLTEYKVVILLIGTYWGTVPGVLDTNGLAAVLLEADGWTVVVLWEQEVLNDLSGTIFKKAPALQTAAIRGGPKVQLAQYPLSYLDRLRQYARAIAFKRTKWADSEAQWGRRRKRQPKRGIRREPTNITKRTVAEDRGLTGVSRYSGKGTNPDRKFGAKFRTSIKAR